MPTEFPDKPVKPRSGQVLESSLRAATKTPSGTVTARPERRSGVVSVELRQAPYERRDEAGREYRVARLRRFPLFSDLEPDELEALSDMFEEMEVAADVEIITQDESDPYLYLLVHGALEVFRRDDKGITTRLHEVTPGEPVGEMGYFAGGLRSASVRTLAPSLLLQARYDVLSRTFEVAPRLAKVFWQVVTQRLRNLSLVYESDHQRRRTAERSLQHLHQFLDLSETQALGAGIEGLIESLVHAASALMNADRASLFLVEPDTGDLWSKVAEGADIREIRLPAGSGLVGWVAEHRELANIEDAYSDARFNQEVDKRTGYKTQSILCGPITNMQNDVIGVVQVINKRIGSFTADDEALFRIFAHQAAVAVDNYFLYSKVLVSHEQMAVMLDIAKSLNETLELPVMIRKMIKMMPQVLQCERSSFFVLDRDTNELWSMEAHGTDVHEIRFPASIGLAGHCATTGELVNVADAYQEPRFNSAVDEDTGLRTRSVLCMPVLNRYGDIVGVTQAMNKSTGAFESADETLLGAIASQIGLVLENAQLYASTVEMKTYLENIQESISNAIVSLDQSGGIVTANKAAAAIFADPALVTKHRNIYGILGDENAYFRSLIDRGYEERASLVQYDVALNGFGAGEGSVNVNVLPLNDSAGEFQGLVVVMEDVTREKRVKSTLTRYMAKDVVDRMLLDPTQQVLGGIRGKASVLFSDIRGFTAIAEQLSAEQTMDLLNEYFTLMVDEVISNEGLLDKFMGDGLMAVFGVPYPHSDDAKNAVRCALGMGRALAIYNEQRASNGLDALSIGIGIHSDDVISGNMGSQKRMEYTVIGDGVNLASRIEGLNKGYGTGILISDSTLAGLDDGFVVRAIDNVIAKGRSEPIQVYEVLGEAGYELSAAEQCFVAGLERYQQQEFTDALEQFRRGAQSGDAPCRTYVMRCEAFIASPPPADWDGVWRATSK